MKRLFLVLVFACAIFLRQLWLPAFPYTHDGENHLARIANYAVALKQGQFPPRWAPSFWGGYGYPVFNFNYPLLNIAAIPFLAVKIPTETTLKLLISFFVVLSVIALWHVLKKRVAVFPATLGTLAWLFAPFTYTNLYVRGAVGEIAAYASGLSVLWMIDRWREKQSKWTALCLFMSMLALMLAHNIITLLIVPIIAVWLIYLSWKKPCDRALCGVIALAMGSSMFFWIPALFEKHFINVESSQVVSEYVWHLPTLDQLFSAPVQFGYSFGGPVDSLSFQVGVSFFVSIVVALMLAGIMKKDRYISLCVGVVGIGSVVLLSQYASFIWENITVLRYLQFPWRLLGFLTLVGGFATAWVVEKTVGVLKTILLIAVALSVLQFLRFPAPSRFTHDDFYYKTFPQTSTILDEDKPKTFQMAIAELPSHIPQVESGVSFTQHTWNGSHHVYTVESEKEHQIIEPTIYFPGWRTTIDGKEVVIDTKKARGLIAFDVPAGKHVIETKMTQHTVPRIVGNFITLLSLALFLFILFRRKHI